MPRPLFPPIVACLFAAAVVHTRVARADDEAAFPSEAAIRALTEEAPAQADVYRRAVGEERRQPALALSLFADVANATTRFDDASQRACHLALYVSTPAIAQPHCEAAAARARTPRNLTSLALWNATPVDGVPRNPERARALVAEAIALPDADVWTEVEACGVVAFLDVREALERVTHIPRLKREARIAALENISAMTFRAKDLAGAEAASRALEAFAPENVRGWSNVCDLAIERQDAAALHRAADGLGRLTPPGSEKPYMHALAYEMEGKIGEARLSVRDAERAGFPSERLTRIRARLATHAPPAWDSVSYVMALVIAAWALLVALSARRAVAVSGALLNEIARGRPLPRKAALSDEEKQRRADYGAALSMLLSLLVPVRFFGGVAVTLAIFAGGPLAWRLVAGNRAPWEPLALVAAAGLVARITRTPPLRLSRGVDIVVDDHPAFAGLLEDVGEAMDAEPVRGVRIVPGSRFRLTLGGSLWKLSRGEMAPALELGLETLRTLDVQAFRAMLVQAHACLAAEELPGATQAVATRARLRAQLLRNSRWWNRDFARPFVWLVERLYRRASLAAVRFQELRGDRSAVAICGPAPFERGLRVLAGEPLDEAAPQASPEAATYRSTPETTPDETIAWDEAAAPYEAAPSLTERLSRARNTRRRTGSEDVDEEAMTPALKLFSRRKELIAAVEAVR